MWPALRPGDLAGFEPLADDPRPGQVVVARVGKRLLVHRVISPSGGTLLLRGDNCAVADPPVRRSEILGEVCLVKRDRRVLDRARWDAPVCRLAGRLVMRAARLAGRLRWR